MAKATADAHAALHDHPWVSRLTLPGLTVQTYRRILSAYHIIYSEVEARRVAADVYAALSLGTAVSALAADISALGKGRARCECPVISDAMGPVEILGALYVLHGSGFGARVLNASVARNLPTAPRAYLAVGTSPDLWRQLKGALQVFAGDTEKLEKLIESANATFHRVGQLVTDLCEGAVVAPTADTNLCPPRQYLH